MDRYLQRTTLLVGENAQAEINRVRIILFGVGGVDTINACTLEHNICFCFNAAQ